MTRIVGTQNRDEFIRDPVEAWHRGRVLDQMLAGVRPPIKRGVMRASHQVFNQMDDLKQLEQARVLNGPLLDSSR
jgi:hypothetical protein